MKYLDRLSARRDALVEQRVVGAVPWMPWNNPYFRFDAGGPAHPSRVYHSPEAALGLPALYAGSKLLAESVASMPLRVYQKYDSNGAGARKLYGGPSIFDQPSLDGTQFDWIFAAMVSCILQGNAWGWITGRDGYGYPTGIEWLPPEDVFVQEARDLRSANPLDARVYVLGRETRWHGPDSELFHVKGFPLAGRVEGLSLLMAMSLLISGGHEAMRYGNEWFRNGGFAIGTFQNAEVEVSEEQANEMRGKLMKTLRNRQPLVYGRDWDYKPVTVPANEAQFLQSIQMTANQVAAIMNLPAGRLGGDAGGSLHYSSQAQDTLQILEATRPWTTRFSQAFSRILPRNREADFNENVLLKMDPQTKFSVYQIQREIGYRTVNELRELDDLPPLPDGVGDEAIPQALMVAMGTRAGVIPKSVMKAVILEMDVATDRLIKLEKTYIAQGKLPQATPPAPAAGGSGAKPGGNSSPGAAAGPGTTMPPPPGTAPIGKPNAPLPLAQDPASFLASLISVQRDYGMPYEVRETARAAYASILTRAARIAKEEGDATVPADHLLAHWMRADTTRELVLRA